MAVAAGVLLSFRDMLNEQILWDAVLRRDPAWDGAVVYAVRSTGIYCRPSCPSRRPRAGGVRFFAAPADARAAGFRACRRCHPDDEMAVPPGIERVRRVCRAIAAQPGRRLSLARLAGAVRASPHHLLRSFQAAIGITPREYAEACRVGCLKRELRNGQDVTSAVYEAGYGSASRVYESASATLGMTPGAYARGGAGERVEYAIVPSPLGRLLVAATAKGVCAVALGDSDPRLEAELRAEYPRAAVTSGSPRFREWTGAIVAALQPGAPDLRLPLDVRATAFQRLVWRELQRIPRGTTRSYQEVARRLGRPEAARAVARACATNPVALVVPCHRVVRQNGAAGGYRWGTARKQKLLDVERG
jgi:AraC family transcriptional regulator, regulatory protein of adaptative response / methylated-DNA-[protein]-cysteine methyltransferase